MNGRERVIKTITFSGPDRIPTDLWILPAAEEKYGKKLYDLIEKYDTDIVSLSGPYDLSFDDRHYKIGSFTDNWGSLWRNIQEGIVGEVKIPALEDESMIKTYKAPVDGFTKSWKNNRSLLVDQISDARSKGKFIIGGWVHPFERIQFLRGTENFYCDLAGDDKNVRMLISIISEFYDSYLEEWLDLDVDAIAFADDWGSQISLLISKPMWIEVFKPLYARLMRRARDSGKYIFFHSDGFILDLYDQFIDLGVCAINSQIWCMGVDKVAAKYAGKITFWGEISRQDILPSGTPVEVAACKRTMIDNLFVNGGGLIGQSEVNKDVPIANIEEILKPWS